MTDNTQSKIARGIAKATILFYAPLIMLSLAMVAVFFAPFVLIGKLFERK